MALRARTTMHLKPLLYHVSAMALAYGIVVAVPLIVDFVFDTRLEIWVIVWLNAGLLVLHVREVPYPPPATARIDVRGGLVVLWWALFWPRYLLRR